MKSMYSCLCIIVILIIEMKMPTSGATKSICPISQDILQIQRYFEAVKDTLHYKDTITQVSLLKASAMNKIQSSERCCFLLKLGTFYVTNVFPQMELITSKTHREFIHLANSMLGLKMELKHCHSTMRCPCGEQAHGTMEEFKKEYYKMDSKAAVIKAIGDMNILFRWMEKNFVN